MENEISRRPHRGSLSAKMGEENIDSPIALPIRIPDLWMEPPPGDVGAIFIPPPGDEKDMKATGKAEFLD